MEPARNKKLRQEFPDIVGRPLGGGVECVCDWGHGDDHGGTTLDCALVRACIVHDTPGADDTYMTDTTRILAADNCNNLHLMTQYNCTLYPQESPHNHKSSCAHGRAHT